MIFDLDDTSRSDLVIRHVAHFERDTTTKFFGVAHTVYDRAAISGNHDAVFIVGVEILRWAGSPEPDVVGAAIGEFDGVSGDGEGAEANNAPRDGEGVLHVEE
jgi:hypothetical protein